MLTLIGLCLCLSILTAIIFDTLHNRKEYWNEAVEAHTEPRHIRLLISKVSRFFWRCFFATTKKRFAVARLRKTISETLAEVKQVLMLRLFGTGILHA